MRMKLYQLEIKRVSGAVKGYILAPSEARAAEVVFELIRPDNPEGNDFTLARVDETIADEMPDGLHNLLEYAPVGMASYSHVIGWVSHVAKLPALQLFRIEEVKGSETFIIAPDSDIANAIYINSVTLVEGEPKLFRISNGVADLPAERIRNLNSMLEFGPAGVVTFDDEHGWSLEQ
ncbi:hypothetical protein [uncultured Parasphingorhabdus sp.]|uniref:hypothetical protein n=1 Tax=uncultured Parasphingorhabdus sp. TaxID=2709694 RepID=UPI002AA850FE|nr:hypothetical protein [uncultured Parasphingorhabdus sp.]